jgi:glucose/arabinose dehydrogenase
MKHLARICSYALVALGFYAQNASAQLATGDPTNNFTLTDWVTGVNNVTDLVFMSDGRAVILTKRGLIAVADKDGNLVKNPAAMLTVDTVSEKGLLGVVRDDQDNLYLYVSNGPSDTDKHRVYKGRLAADGTVTVDLDNPIVTGGLEGPRNHDGGGMIIHKNQLYIGVGDTGANDTPPVNMYGACLNKANGKILRVNLDGSIPADNPLNNLAAVTGCSARTGVMYEMLPPDKRIYAWGFRNPWRLWIDPKTDLMWIGDVGETTQEEITVGGKGSNHGWPFNEGTMKYSVALGGLSDCMQMTPATACVPPQDTYQHGSLGDGASVTGGVVPREGCGWGAYETKYFFADFNHGNVWTIDLKPDRTGAVAGSRKPFAGMGASSVVSFRNGPDGAMYIASYSQGSVKRIAPRNIPPACVAAAPSPPGTGGSGGSAGAGGSGGAAGSGAGGTGMAPAPGNPDSGGCSCNLSGRSSGSLLLGVLMVTAALLARRRRR